MNFELLSEFGETLRLVKDFKYFPFEWEKEIMDLQEDYEREEFQDFAIKSLDNLGDELPSLDSVSKKNLDGFFEASNEVYNLVNYDKFYMYYKKGELKYLQGFKKDTNFNFFRTTFLDSIFSLTKKYYGYPDEEYGRLFEVRRSANFKFDTGAETEILQYSANNFEINFHLNNENLFELNIDSDKNQSHSYIVEKIKEKPYLFRDVGEVVHLFKNIPIKANEKYKTFEKMDFKNAIIQWAGFK